eukprot:scaffold108454_cov76-Phaeocystis_antarctica.AAC.8
MRRSQYSTTLAEYVDAAVRACHCDRISYNIYLQQIFRCGGETAAGARARVCAVSMRAGACDRSPRRAM